MGPHSVQGTPKPTSWRPQDSKGQGRGPAWEPLTDKPSFPEAGVRLRSCLPPSQPQSHPRKWGAPGLPGQDQPWKPLSGSLTYVLGTGQGEGQGPERGQHPAGDTHPAEGGEKAPGQRLRKDLSGQGPFVAPRAGSGPSGFTWEGGAGPALPLTRVNSRHWLGAGQPPATGRDGHSCQSWPGGTLLPWPPPLQLRCFCGP